MRDHGKRQIVVNRCHFSRHICVARGQDYVRLRFNSHDVALCRFEAADPFVFTYHIQNQGASANLFIDHSPVVQLACLRRGIWGTGSTFGRVVTFEGTGGSDKQERSAILDDFRPPVL